ncbi:MAG: YceI family protein [Bacteroidales bacterium]|nr:YceI family protein [Bacteroidales bacterium]
MKTKISILAILIASFAIISCNNSKNENKDMTVDNVDTEQAVEYQLILDKSVVNWSGSMSGLYGHTGTLEFKDGLLMIQNEKVVGGNFIVDMNSMLTTDADANYAMASREKLIEHLQSDDFFATSEFPTSSFEISGPSGDNLVGKLTIRGNTNDELIENVVVQDNGDEFTITGNLTFDRQKYGVAYSTGMTDKILSDEIELDIVLTVRKSDLMK